MKSKKLKAFVVILAIFAGIFAVVCLVSSIVFDNIIGQPSGRPADASQWNLTLVNSDFSIPEGYKFELFELSNGEKIDSRIYPDLQKMFDDMRAEELYPFVREGYRTAEQQKDIIREITREKMAQGHLFVFDAYNEARKTAAAVGNSEHQLGLAVDINADIDKSDEWEVYIWLEENAWKYGFILRYPLDKTDITGISYEPWHYRYVGKEAAEEIHNRGICLEEYLA